MDDWALLSNLSHCYNESNGFPLAQQFIREQNNLPPKMRYKLSRINELFASMIDRSQRFFQMNSYFISLCSHDRSILLHNTMQYIGGLGICYTIRQTSLFNNISFCKSVEIIYGSNLITTSNRIINQLNFDSTFFKIILALLSFSTLNYTNYTDIVPVNLIDIKTILRIQNMYTELAWRYLVCKYNHKEAVVYFSDFIRCVCSFNDIFVEAYELQHCTDMD